MESSVDTIEEVRQIHIRNAALGDRLYKMRESEFVGKDQVFFIKQNEHVVWVVSREKLTQPQFIQLLNQYLEKEYEASLKRG